MTPLFARLFEAFDERVGVSKKMRKGANKIFPGHWSFLLGEVALFSFAILVLTGMFMMAFYRPSIEAVTYSGTAELFHGRDLPAAYGSIIRLSHDVPGGLFIRRVHRLCATVFVMAILLHLVRIVLTGAFRKPRELNYYLGVILLILAVASGYTGENLLFDVLSGTSLRIAYSLLLSIPFAGETIAQWLFGGEFPTGDIIPRLYVAHILLLPALIGIGIALHLWLVVRQTHTQLPRAGIDARRSVVGEPMWPHQAATSLTLALALAALLAGAAVLVPWADVELAGPYIVGAATNASQPEWFLFWLEGALRLHPGWSWEVIGTVISGVFVVGVMLPVVITALLFGYPAIEGRVVGRDDADHHETQGPFDVPFRFGSVVGMATLLFVLSTTAGHDVIARLLHLSIETVTWVLRIAVVVAPIVLGVAAAAYARWWNRRYA